MQHPTPVASRVAHVRPFTAADVDFAMAQAVREGWTPARTWFEVFLAHDPGGCFVLEADGAPAGTVTTTCFGRSAWIGYLIVSPDQRRSGFGTRLMTRALDHIDRAGIQTVRLDADPPGVNIYRRLGFVDEFESRRFRLETPPADRPTTVVPITGEKLEEVARLDHAAFGDDRARLLRLLFQHAEAGFVAERAGRVAGYVFVIATTAGVHVGPCVAEDPDVARDLWSGALRAARGRTITAGIGAPSRDAVKLIRSLGFTATTSSIRMVRGPVTAIGAVGHVFAIGSGAFG